MKKITAIVLCAAMLALPFVMRTGAAGDPAYVPVITKQPKPEVTAFTNKDLILEVEAKLPEGVEGTLSYAWYAEAWNGGLVGTDAKLVYRSGSIYYRTSYFQVEVTNTYLDEDGQEQTASVTSESCVVTFIEPLGYTLLIWALNPFVAIPYEFLHNPANLILFPIMLPVITFSVIAQSIQAIVAYMPKFFAALSS